MKKAKKIAAALLSAVMVLTLMSIPVNAADFCSQVPNGNNINAQNYSYYYAKVINSYLTETPDGTLMRVQGASDGKAYVEYYSPSYSPVGQKTIPAGLPLFGGFYSSGDNYYILSGQQNDAEDNSVEVYRVTKYDTDWNELGHASLFGANTYIPFDAGSARFDMCGNYLLIRTCHEMYQSSDGYHHQANVTIEIDTESMTVSDSYMQVMNSTYGYVSHSFNQFIKVEDSHIIAVDHGDAYPRSVALIRYTTDCSTGRFTPDYYNRCGVYSMLDIYGSIGANYTGVQVGGFEISDTSYIVTGTTTEQAENASDTANVFVSSMNKADNTVTFSYITDIKEGSANPSNTRLTALGDNSFMLFWSIGTTVYYCKLDSAGNVCSEIYSMNGNLSDCDPIVADGKVIWYTYSNSAVTFYEVELSQPANNSAVTVENGHNWELLSVDSTGNAQLVCSKCGETRTGVLPSKMSLYWEQGDGWWYSSAPSTVFSGTQMGVNSSYNSYSGNAATLKDFEVISSDESIAVVSGSTRGAEYRNIIWKKSGTVTITIRNIYNPDISRAYTVKVIDYISEKNSGIIDRENGFIYGINAGSASINDYITPTDGVTLNLSAEKLSTDVTVDVVYGGKTVESYKLVIFGDVNGDGWYDGQDAAIVSCIADGMLAKNDVPAAEYFAADCTHDGVIDSTDVLLLMDAGVLLQEIDQTKSEEELLETSSAYVEYLSLIDQTVNAEAAESAEDEPVDPGFTFDFFDTLLSIIKEIISVIKSVTAFFR